MYMSSELDTKSGMVGQPILQCLAVCMTVTEVSMPELITHQENNYFSCQVFHSAVKHNSLKYPGNLANIKKFCLEVTLVL